MTVKLGRCADALGVGAVKLLMSLAVLAGGFRAVSDDDYARVVIAERFAETPHLDASGTSWLPFPFWIYGAAQRLFGVGLSVARVTAVVLGVLAVLLLLAAARLLGAGRSGALTGALIAALFPWSAWLGAATVPEAPTAALVVYGLATLAVESPRTRLAGALALAAACFSRYEAWPVAFGFAAFTGYDALRAFGARVRARVFLFAALLSLSAVVLWLLHGRFVHGATFFFFKRVAGYRHALGGEAPVGERLFAVPRALLDAPELWFGVLAFATGIVHPRLARPLFVSLLLLAFLAAGELAGGGPTHHAGRAVLPVWYLAALAIGQAVEGWRGSRRALGLCIAASVVVLGWLYRSASPPGFPDRRDAVRTGSEARRLNAPLLLIDTPDYSYLAVTAAFGTPTRTQPFDDHDPRHPRPPDAFASEATLRTHWAAHPSAWLVVSRSHSALAARLGNVRARTDSLVLVAPGG
jgi:hypothetical protein